jgi:hypothetical protein
VRSINNLDELAGGSHTSGDSFNDDLFMPSGSHTPQKSGHPLNLGHAICIDTWVYGDGWLTCLDTASGRYWQANEGGRTRTGIS